MILLVDNYDSFVFNLARYLVECGREVEVRRNDEIRVEEAASSHYEAVVLSPGPGTPARSGICVELVRTLHAVKPILGICLGHQAIAEALGARVVCSRQPRHGVSSPVFHEGEGIFAGLESPIEAARYHSLVVSPTDLPPELEVIARSLDGDREVIMGLRHREFPTIGLQFHPESILTTCGHRLLENFLTLVPGPASDLSASPLPGGTVPS